MLAESQADLKIEKDTMENQACETEDQDSKFDDTVKPRRIRLIRDLHSSPMSPKAAKRMKGKVHPADALSQWKMLVLNALMHWHMPTTFWKKPCDAETGRSLMMPEPVAGCAKMHHLRLSSITLDLRNSQHASSHDSDYSRLYNLLNLLILYNRPLPLNMAIFGIFGNFWGTVNHSINWYHFFFTCEFTTRGSFKTTLISFSIQVVHALTGCMWLVHLPTWTLDLYVINVGEYIIHRSYKLWKLK